jgi:L-lactate dehydrogenase complex protein LldG
VSAREEVLARVRAALATAPPDVTAADRQVPRGYRSGGEYPPGHPVLLDLLVDRLQDYRARIRRTTENGLAEAIAAALDAGLQGAERKDPPGRTRVVVPPGLPPAWLAAADVEVIPDEGLDASDLDALDAVVTASAVAIAETGTIVLDASPDQGRRVITLLPDLHVCVVRAEQVVFGVPEALAGIEPTRAQTWISGPSATSDIELTRVEGVHGPRILEVVLVEPSPD